MLHCTMHLFLNQLFIQKCILTGSLCVFVAVKSLQTSTPAAVTDAVSLIHDSEIFRNGFITAATVKDVVSITFKL